MKTIKIENKEYKLEYSFEASLYGECIDKVMKMLLSAANLATAKDMTTVLAPVSNVPSVAFTMFYAGLLEHHGASGDGSVPNEETAKKLMKKYLSETKSDFYSLMNELLEVMSDDGFFALSGLAKIFEAPKTAPQSEETLSK